MTDDEDYPKEIELGADAVIYTSTNETQYEHVEGKSIETIVLDESNPVMIGKAWICKVCDLNNMGVICSECKKMYNPADPDCELKD